MKKILCTIAMLLAVATVLSSSGCAKKEQTTGNELQETSNVTSKAMTNMNSAAMTNNDSNSSSVVDVVCKMKVDKSVVDTSVYEGKKYYFCSPDCKKQFDENPEKYINSFQNST